jgi:hypothetical protein
MTVAILDVRPTFEPGVKVYASWARGLAPRFALEPRTSDRRQLQCYWRSDRHGRIVCVWESVHRAIQQQYTR